MTARLPTLMVVTPKSAPALVAAFTRLEEPFAQSTASAAAEAVSQGTARVVLCERMTGWHALAMRVEHAGGVLVLWGEPLSDTDRRGFLPGYLPTCDSEDLLAEVLDAARSTLGERHAPGQVPATPSEASGHVIRVAQLLTAQLDLQALAHEVRSQVRDLCKADLCELWIVDEVSGDLLTPPGPAQSMRIGPGVGLVGGAAREGNQRIIQGDQLHPNEDPRPTGEKGTVCRGVVIPLVHRGDVLGVMQLVRAVSAPDFSENELQSLSELAPHVAIAVQNAHLTRGLLDAQVSMLSVNAELERRVQERTAQIAHAKREWERTFDAIEEPIALQNGFTLRRANRAYAKRVGVPITEVPGRICHELLAGRSTPCVGCPLLKDDSDLRGEIAPRPGWYFQFSGFQMPNEKGNTSMVVIHYRDVAPQKELEARLRESERMASLGQLASGAAHEINNPLGFVTSNLRSLGDALTEVLDGLEGLTGPDTAKRLLSAGDVRTLLNDGGEMIREALQGTDRVARIVQALRELSRQEFGQVELTNVNASVERALRAELGGDAGRVQLKLESTDQAKIAPLQLDRAVAQVLRNAHQAVKKPEDIFVRTFDEGSNVRISIVDQGHGIAAEHLHRVFEPFFTTRGIGKGIGLGLTAAYGIIQRAGGNIEVKSEHGAGSTFSIVLPRFPANDSVQQMDPSFLAVS